MDRRQRTKSVWVAGSVIAISAIVGLLTSIASNQLPVAWQPHLWLAWPFLGFMVVIFIALGVWQARAGLRKTRASQSAPEQDRRYRQIMLDTVQRDWIDGILHQSLYAVARLALGLETKPEAVEKVWNLYVQQPNQAPEPFPPGTRIHEAFDRFQGLLILGAPGTGKTTLLLELTQTLLARARQANEDATRQDTTAHPMPVVFHLSAWAEQRLPLTTWLAEELNKRYGVSPTLAQRWVAEDQILPLLDGLDEVAAEHRGDCIEAINVFRQEHGLLPLVVCCRIADYV